MGMFMFGLPVYRETSVFPYFVNAAASGERGADTSFSILKKSGVSSSSEI